VRLEQYDETNYAKQMMMMNHYDGNEFVKGFTTE
jgi:hypothetical protein